MQHSGFWVEGVMYTTLDSLGPLEPQKGCDVLKMHSSIRIAAVVRHDLLVW